MSTAKELVKTDRAIWVVADTHFRHADALAWYGRPQPTVDAMDDALVDAINARVGAKDVLVHLGDFARLDDWTKAELDRVAALRARIACRRIHLVRGNHDPVGERRFDDLFESVDEIVSARGIAGIDERVVLFHYPIDQWQGRPNGGFHLHGHVHGHGATVARRHDCGVDVAANAFGPRRLVDLVAELRATPPSGYVRA
jgi:calcineurin-like phosphoesterase family protein